MRKLILLALLLALVGCKKATKVSDNNPPNQPGGGSGGAAQSVRKAVGRAATQNDMQQLHLYIENASAASGRMPTQQQLAADLQKEAPNLYKLWADKVIDVTKMPQRESIWAFTVEPVSTAGYHLLISNNGVERMDTQTLTQKLKEQGDL